MTGPLARFRKPEALVPAPVQEKPKPAKKKKLEQPLVAKKPKGTATPSVMGRPRPVGDPHAELLWRAERLVRKLAKIPKDKVHVPVPSKEVVPPEWRMNYAKKLAGECGLPAEMSLSRNRNCFWRCLEVLGWIHCSFPKAEREAARAQFATAVRDGLTAMDTIGILFGSGVVVS